MRNVGHNNYGIMWKININALESIASVSVRKWINKKKRELRNGFSKLDRNH